MRLLRASARAMLSGLFLAGGASAVTYPDQLLPMARRVTDHVAPVLEKMNLGLPTQPRTLVQLNGVVQVVGGLLLPTALHRPAAVMLAASLVPTTVAGHPFWQTEDPRERSEQQIHFLKNLGVLGGLLLAAVDTEGRPGIRWRAGHLAGHAGRSAQRAARGSWMQRVTSH
jgi:putative oxidoreductase